MSAREALLAVLKAPPPLPDRYEPDRIIRELAAAGVYLVTAETLAEAMGRVAGGHSYIRKHRAEWDQEAAAILAALPETSA